MGANLEAGWRNGKIEREGHEVNENRRGRVWVKKKKEITEKKMIKRLKLKRIK